MPQLYAAQSASGGLPLDSTIWDLPRWLAAAMNRVILLGTSLLVSSSILPHAAQFGVQAASSPYLLGLGELIW